MMFLLIFLIYSLLTVSEELNETWDLDEPCQIYIQRFAVAQANMVRCATNYTSPPKVCTNCIDQFIAFKQMEYDSHHLENVTSLDNTTCSNVIYGNYLMSYSWEISNSLTRNIWEKSRCSSCLEISWDFENRNSSINYDEKTLQFQEFLFEWRDCVTNYSDTLVDGNSSIICNFCEASYDKLFEFYWKIYTDPGVEFCIDVETTMNDTMHIWHNVWKCSDDTKNDRHKDIWMLGGTVIAFAIILTMFYGGSYVQTERAQENLIRYSRIDAPRGQRSRLVFDPLTMTNTEPLEEGVDQLSQWRERCAEHAQKFKDLLEECNERVTSRTNTEETCQQEMMDYVHHLDHCAMPRAFKSLK